ncbi:hypothetical protein IJF91_01255 [Candidatus Saccharibacteria bacterium]|nr:hypothetical protein [Candidatus Saccharibacteria bacterium]
MTLVNEKKPDKLGAKQMVRSERERYRKIKATIYEKELTNDQHVYVYRSSKEWWKVGGNSALYYKYILGPRLKVAINLKRDEDHYSTFNFGVVSIRDIKSFKERMKKAGMVPGPENDNAIKFSFKEKISLSTIDAIKEDVEFQHERINRLVETRKIAPDMFVLIRQFMSEFWHYSKRYNKYEARKTITSEVVVEMMKMKRAYAHMANGDVEILDGMLEIKSCADSLMSDISFLEEVKEMGFDKAMKLSMHLGDIKRIVNRELKKVVKENERINSDGRSE